MGGKGRPPEMIFEGLFRPEQERSKPVLEAYFAWLETVNVLKGSKLAEAITYSVNQKTTLCAFLEDGRIELSNNRVLSSGKYNPQDFQKTLDISGVSA
jgi:hypothetical protein